MCDCVKQFDEALAPKNGRISMALQVTEDMNLIARLCIATEKLDKSKRKPVPAVMASYCPFCGEKMVPNRLNSQAGGFSPVRWNDLLGTM